MAPTDLLSWNLSTVRGRSRKQLAQERRRFHMHGVSMDGDKSGDPEAPHVVVCRAARDAGFAREPPDREPGCADDAKADPLRSDAREDGRLRYVALRACEEEAARTNAARVHETCEQQLA